MTEALEALETRHLRSGCTDKDCWCHDEDYYKEKYGENY